MREGRAGEGAGERGERRGDGREGERTGVSLWSLCGPSAWRLGLATRLGDSGEKVREKAREKVAVATRRRQSLSQDALK